MRQVKCQDCGKAFSGKYDSHYCPICAEKRKKNVLRVRICTDCGQEFMGGPRAKRCSTCALKAKKAANTAFRKHGASRPLGSPDECAWCGEEYSVRSGRQRYCSDTCQRAALLEWQRIRKKNYNEKQLVKEKKKKKRAEQEKICVYCLRAFKPSDSYLYCSDYCKQNQKKLQQCIADIERGQKRNLKKYEDLRSEYRKKCQTDSMC